MGGRKGKGRQLYSSIETEHFLFMVKEAKSKAAMNTNTTHTWHSCNRNFSYRQVKELTHVFLAFSI